jgi:beta-lactamase class A
MGIWILKLLILLALAFPGGARAADPSPELRQRSAELLQVLRGEEAPEKLFAPAFLAQIPAERMKAIAAQLSGSYGRPGGIASIDAKSGLSAILIVDYPKATARVELVLDPAAPHLVTSLLISAIEAKAESAEALVAGFRALPGRISLSAAPLDDEPPHRLVQANADQALAVGSDFKLFILAELVREVRAGERKWSDVVPLSAHSLPSGILQSWPKGAPITLHSLAALMISQSDNTAADALLALVGREKVEALLPELSLRPDPRNRPFLSTREAFLLKAADPALLQAWKAVDEKGRRAILRTLAGADVDRLDLTRFNANPIAIDAVEWFASADDLVRTLDWIRRSGDKTALDILAINPGLPAASVNFAYLGYKGGSESGVLAMAFLVRRKDGSWAAAAAVWNDPAAPVAEARLAALMSPLLTFLR